MRQLFPHYLKHSDRLAAIGGHNGITLGFWTFCNKTTVHPHFKFHEYRHVVQEVLFTVIGLVLNVWLAIHFHLTWWLWPVAIVLAPLWFVVPYLILLIPGYKRNLFELDAERYANRMTGVR